MLRKTFVAAVILFTLFQICSSLDTLDETKNITIGQTLVSSGNIFELGFFKPSMSTNWFVGIWFVVSPEIIVWVANPDNPLNHNSTTLTISRGAVALVDPSGYIVWSSSVNSSIARNISNSSMQLLDSGNLVIKDSKTADIIWQSFNYLSNTLLPGMKLGKNLAQGFEWYLSSWKSAVDPSKGHYNYKMDPLSVPQNILWNGALRTFRSGQWNGLRFSGIPEMKSYEDMFDFKLVSDVSEVYFSFEAKKGAPLSRVVLNETTGTVQRMVWVQTSLTWSEFWSGPKDPCDYYGKCGPFGICNINEAPVCSCLHGFYPKSPEVWSMRNFSAGCQRKTQLSCNSSDNGFYSVKGVKVPDTHSATVDSGISIEECRNRCLINCSCLAYSVLDIRGGGSGCITWTNDLIDVRYIPGAQDLYIKTAKTELARTGNRMWRDAAIIGSIVFATVVFLPIILITSIKFMQRKKLRRENIDEPSGSLNSTELLILDGTNLRVFDLAALAASTGNFSPENKIAEGGFGVVYKGQLPNGEEIAVKKLLNGGPEEFDTEVRIIAKLQHRNLIRLLGFCIEDEEKMLIYEYMSNKSLDFFIFDKESRKSLNWNTRIEIVLGISRGLVYLHQDSRVTIIHRDLKAANILLDQHMTPKISDFGTARLFRKDENEIITEIVVGTRGYMSPEYAMEGIMSEKSDVYSFGVLLLEIISGKKNQGNQNLLAYAWKLWEEGNSIHLADEEMDSSSIVASEVVTCIHVGLLCIQEYPDDRPTMSDVLLMLSSKSPISAKPNKPRLCTRTTSPSAMFEHLLPCTNELTITLEGR